MRCMAVDIYGEDWRTRGFFGAVWPSYPLQQISQHFLYFLHSFIGFTPFDSFSSSCTQSAMQTISKREHNIDVWQVGRSLFDWSQIQYYTDPQKKENNFFVLVIFSDFIFKNECLHFCARNSSRYIYSGREINLQVDYKYNVEL